MNFVPYNCPHTELKQPRGLPMTSFLIIHQGCVSLADLRFLSFISPSAKNLKQEAKPAYPFSALCCFGFPSQKLPL